MKPSSMIAQYEEHLQVVAWFFCRPTYREIICIRAMSNALLTVASLLKASTGPILNNKYLLKTFGRSPLSLLHVQHYELWIPEWCTLNDSCRNLYAKATLTYFLGLILSKISPQTFYSKPCLSTDIYGGFSEWNEKASLQIWGQWGNLTEKQR